MRIEAVGLGLCAWDTVCLFRHYPGPNKKVEVISSIASGGGPVPTSLAVFSKLGGRASFIGMVGDDREGDLLRRDLESFGVYVSHLILRPRAKTPRAYIWVDRETGDRTVALDRGDAEPIKPEELPLELLRKTPLLLMNGRDAEICLEAARICRESGGTVILDAGSPRQDIQKLLAVTEHAVVSSDFVSGTFPGYEPERAAAEIQAQGPSAVVITSGDEGGFWREGDRSGRYPAFQVEVVDTTGAGDAFHGGYLYGVKMGWDMPRRCRFASAVAALTCRALGGRSAAPTLEEVESFVTGLGP